MRAAPVRERDVSARARDTAARSSARTGRRQRVRQRGVVRVVVSFVVVQRARAPQQQRAVGQLQRVKSASALAARATTCAELYASVAIVNRARVAPSTPAAVGAHHARSPPAASMRAASSTSWQCSSASREAPRCAKEEHAHTHSTLDASSNDTTRRRTTRQTVDLVSASAAALSLRAQVDAGTRGWPSARKKRAPVAYERATPGTGAAKPSPTLKKKQRRTTPSAAASRRLQRRRTGNRGDGRRARLILHAHSRRRCACKRVHVCACVCVCHDVRREGGGGQRRRAPVGGRARAGGGIVA